MPSNLQQYYLIYNISHLPPTKKNKNKNKKDLEELEEIVHSLGGLS